MCTPGEGKDSNSSLEFLVRVDGFDDHGDK